MNDVSELVRAAEARLQPAFAHLEEIALKNEKRVLDAFRAEPVSPRHFAPTEGYGYDDLGRDALDRVFARALQTEDALVRPQIANGTHAIFLALSGLLEPRDVIFSATGRPYDTLETAVGLSGSEPNALARFGIEFRMAELQAGEPEDRQKPLAAALSVVKLSELVERPRAWQSCARPTRRKARRRRRTTPRRTALPASAAAF